MKLTFMFFMIGLLQVSASVYSQTTKLTLKMRDAKVAEVLDAIEYQSEFRFAYSSGYIDLDRKLTVDIREKTVDESLKVIFEGTDVEYAVRDRHILLFPSAMDPGSNTVVAHAKNFQGRTVSGKVTDSGDQPLPGVTIMVKGTTAGTVTNEDGEYTLPIFSGYKTLQFSFVGMKTQEVVVGSQTRIDVKMEEEIIGIDEVVAVGYGTQKRLSISGSISTLEAEKVRDVPVTHLSNSLAGRISGLYINQKSSFPGLSADMRIRAKNTWKGGSVLFVIDGIISDKKAFDALDASEVENISVLKDAASGAIYGARAANGVMLVKTKRGTKGKFKLNYGYSNTTDRAAFTPEFASLQEQIEISNYSRVSQGNPPIFDEQEIAYFKDNDPGKQWMELGYRDPSFQKHHLSASGGSDRIKYFVGGSYVNQEGMIPNANYNKANLRANLDLNFTDNLSGIFNFSYSNGTAKRSTPSDGDYNVWGNYYWLLAFAPFYPATTSDGKLINGQDYQLGRGNAIGNNIEGGVQTTEDLNIDILMGLTYKVPFVDGLSVSAKLSRNDDISIFKRQTIKHTMYNVVRKGSNGMIFTDEIIGSQLSQRPSREELRHASTTGKGYQANLFVNYNKSFGKHGVEAVFVHERSERDHEDITAGRQNFPLLKKDQWWATGSSMAESFVYGGESEFGRSSYIGRAMYNYDEKYFVNLTARYDGSMLFAPDYRWGFFPSVSASWVLSSEDFFNVDFINLFKIRAAWGNSGNDAVGGWAWDESFSSVGSYLFSSMQPRVRYNGIVNTLLTWEKTREWNIGFDSRFFNGFTLNLDYYFRHNYDILGSRIASVPVSFGGNMPPENYGIVDAQGIEVELGYTRKIGQVNFNAMGTFGYSTNEVKLKDVAENVRDYNNPNGKPTDYMVSYVSTGMLRTQEDLDALPEGYRINGLVPVIGMLNYQDVSGPTEGVPDGIIDGYDRQVLKGKHRTPPYMFGLNLSADWKGLGIDANFQGVAGVDKEYVSRHFNAYPAVRMYKYWTDMVTPENPDGEYPTGFWGGQYGGTIWTGSDFWIKDGSYVRLGLLNLRYSLPEKIIKKLRVADDISLNLSGTNLFTITNWKYTDPTMYREEDYPVMKSYTMGINVTF